MTPEAFVSGIKTIVHDRGIRAGIDTLERPNGPRPERRLIELSQWFHSLSPQDKTRVQQVMALAVHSGVFGVLAVLDGLYAVEGDTEKGRFELAYHSNGKREPLNGGGQTGLHEIYQKQVYEQVFGVSRKQ
jgi:hypothetical protein